MRLVDRTAPGQVGFNYMWAPTWIGMNSQLVREIDEHLATVLVGRELTEDTLDLGHQTVLAFLESKFGNINGLFDYLDGLKYVATHGNAQGSEEAKEEEWASSSEG